MQASVVCVGFEALGSLVQYLASRETDNEAVGLFFCGGG